MNTFVSDLVEMAKATEELPRAHERIAQLEAQHFEDGERIARLEMRLMDAHAERDELQSKLRSAEVERDDAGFRLLEAEDRLDAVKRALGVPEVVVGSVTQVPIVEERRPDGGVLWENATPSPTVETGLHSAPVTASIGDAASQVSVSISDGPQSVESPSAGESVPLPSQESGIFGLEVTLSRPYAGHRYWDWPRYIPLWQWLEGGGTEEDYNWRPDATQASA